ncbi:MAG TPA: sulfotransferase [Rhodanobacter sp.]|nr:sulfotransferase [Rhodanobacter sp.]
MLLLGLSLQHQGKPGMALEAYERLTRLHPHDALHWGNYAAALEAAGQLEAAEAAARTAVEFDPADAGRLEQLGLLQLRRNNPLAARDTLLRAYGKSPGSAGIRIHAARACAECRDYRSDELLQPWREWLPLEDSLQFELADLHAETGEVLLAQEVLEDLLRRTPSHLPAQLLLVSVYERINRLESAAELLQRIAVQGTAGEEDFRCQMEHQRAQLALRSREYAGARAILEQCGPRGANDYAHWFSLATVCDRLGDLSGTMRALQIGHSLQIEEFKVATPSRFGDGVPVLPRVDARVAEADYRAWPELRAPDATQSPVFVVGFPRSGTTLLEQMLDAHPQLQSMDERPFFNMLADQLENFNVEIPADLGKLDQRDCDELRKGYLTLACSKVPRRWDARLVDKNPLNMLWLPMIHRLYPVAKFILAVRHPCDVILSCYMQNFRAAPLAVASESLERLAQAYVAAMECWLFHVDVMKPDVFVSRYEDLVADPPGQTRRIAEFLQLEDAASMLRFDARAREKGYIATPSYTQVIEPINTNGLNRWHRYRENFEPVLPILRPMLERWNYIVD